MFEPDSAHHVGDRQQEFVGVVMLRAVDLDRLLDELLVRIDLFGCRGQFCGIVGIDVEIDARAERPLLVIAPRQHGRVDQDFVIGLLIAVGRAGRLRRQARRRGPADRVFHGRLYRNLPGEIARRIEAHRIPLQSQHVGRHHYRTLVTGSGGEELQIDVERLGTGGHVDVEGVDIDRVARPRQFLAARANVQPGQLVELARRRMVAGQPFREEQHHMACGNAADRLARREDAAACVGRIDVERDRAGKADVLCGGDRVDIWHRLRLGIFRQHRGGGGEQQGSERGTTDHSGFFRERSAVTGI